MPYWDRAYGDQQGAGGHWWGSKDPGRLRHGNILKWRTGTKITVFLTGSGSGPGGDRARGQNSNKGRGGNS